MSVLSQLKQTTPNFHEGSENATKRGWALVMPALQWIADNVPQGTTSLEVGSGWSSCVLLERGPVTTIDPKPGKSALIRNWLHQHGFGDWTSNWRHYETPSWSVLPQLIGEYGFVLVDGNHGYPHPTLDWFYASRLLKVGGWLMLDDTQLWSSDHLDRFLQDQPEWEEIWRGSQTVVFQLTRSFDTNQHHVNQPFTMRRSRTKHTGKTRWPS